MTISDTLKKAGNAVMSAAKQKAADAIANEKARNKAQKTAWKKMSTGTWARNIDSYGEFAPAIIWVSVDGVYATDKYRAGIVEITGEEAEKFRSSSEGAAVIAKQSRSGYGSVSPTDVEIPDYLTGTHPADRQPHPLDGLVSLPPQAMSPQDHDGRKKRPQTYEEWMGF